MISDKLKKAVTGDWYRSPRHKLPDVTAISTQPVLAGPFRQHSRMGVYARSSLRAFITGGYNPYWIDTHYMAEPSVDLDAGYWPGELDAESAQNTAIDPGITLLFSEGSQTYDVLQLLPRCLYENRYTIAHWEASYHNITSEWARALPYLDEIWVGNRAGYRILEPWLHKKRRTCAIVPHPIAAAFTAVPHVPRDKQESFTILTVINGDELQREYIFKLIDKMIEVFTMRLRPLDSATLVIHVSDYTGGKSARPLKELIDKITEANMQAGQPMFKLSMGLLSEVEYHRLFAQADLYAAVNAYSGFDHNILMARMHSVPVMLTQAGGNIELIDGTYVSVAAKADDLTAKGDNGWRARRLRRKLGLRFAYVNTVDLSNALRDAVRFVHREDSKEFLKRDSMNVIRKFGVWQYFATIERVVGPPPAIGKITTELEKSVRF